MKKNKINLKNISFPLPFKIEAINKNNKEDVEKAKLLTSMAEYEWNNGGREKFLGELGKKFIIGLLKNYEKK